MNKYDPKKIEAKWQKFWEENKTFGVFEDTTQEKFYGLIEFPYPSGAGLHVGHPRSYTAMDVITRQKRMEGKNVLFPIGFDSFGLPTENFAIKTGRPPQEITDENIATFTRQLKSLGYGFDWDRAVTTSEPEYYKWTQWIFLQLFKHGLAYKANQPINWCPKDKIGLANEEVVDGCCERCGNPVEKRNKEQWMLAITKYADKLLEGLNEVDYIARAKVQQENWIGKSEGAEINFTLNVPGQEPGKHNVTVFTTRPDTLFGATFLAISAELAKKWLDIGWQASDEVKKYIAETLQSRTTAVAREEIEKTGVTTNVVAINPASGEEIPVWVVNYVMGDYGTGAIMAVPAHDERDFEFAKKYDLPIKIVVRAENARYLVIEKSLLEDCVSRLSEFGTVAIEKTDDDWGKFFQVIVLPDKEEDFISFLAENLLETSVDGGSWYADSMGSTNVIVLKNKVFRINDFKEIQSFKKYGHSVGIPDEQLEIGYEAFTNDGLSVNSNFLNELSTLEAKEKIIQYLEEKGIGKRQINYKLRDWVFSRQRYWGEPIPLVFCENCKGWIPLPEDQLPLTLPNVEKYLPTDTGESPLAPMADWVNTKCPQCGGPARRETDTMPNWAGSSWYWLRYADPHNAQNFFTETDFRFKPEIQVTEKDTMYLEAFKKIYTELDAQGVPIFAANRLLLNGLNGRLWLPLKTVSVMYWERDTKKVFAYLNDEGYTLITENKGGHTFERGDVRVEMIPVFEENSKMVSYSTAGVEQPMTIADLVRTESAHLQGFWYRTVSPEYNLRHLIYLRDHESDGRVNERDEEKIAFLESYIKNLNPKIQYFMPVDWYNGGMEHTVLHLLYSRFWNQFLYDIGVVPTREPYKKRTSHGMILANDGQKMSKSLGNVINPDEMVEQYGADALRAYIMFMGPFDQAVEWDTNGLVGVRRFLDRVWNLQEKITENRKQISDNRKQITNNKIQTILHQTIKKISDDIESMRFNTAIAKLMELSNEMTKEEKIDVLDYQTFITLLSPFAPHIAEELWSLTGGEGSVAYAPWPQYDPELAKELHITVVVQVNGKVRDEFTVSAEISEEEIKQIVLSSEKVQKWLEGREPKKVIYVKGKLVSVVI